MRLQEAIDRVIAKRASIEDASITFSYGYSTLDEKADRAEVEITIRGIVPDRVDPRPFFLELRGDEVATFMEEIMLMEIPS